MEPNDETAVTTTTTATTTTTTNNNDNSFSKTLYINQLRISACCERLALHVRTAPENDTSEFCNLCLSLARGIGYAIANKEVPDKVLELPILLKQVCQLRNEAFPHAAVLLLMISVKNACENKWFSDQDSEGLCSLTNEILSSFCSTMNFNSEPNNSLSTLSTIMSRYYPKMKMGEILAFLEVKPGYQTCIRDFIISKDTKPSTGERARLFVAQMDNTETSSCLTTPTQANFLLNGRGVDGRNNTFMDTGPQMPTYVFPLLRYGTNLLQAVGRFDGNYIVVVAFMSMVPTPDHSALQDYVQPTPSMVDSDSELIEGPSRISLNCPISFKRINVPVKGHMCKHLQCFDYANYMEINSRRPSWRCPHCNQNVCFSDICIDQNMAKVLKEVGDNVNNVIISSDGSWKAIIESDDHNNNPQDKTITPNQDEPAKAESPGFSSGPPDVLDLTVDDYEVDTFNICEIEDRVISSANCQSQSNVQNLTAKNKNEINRTTAPQIEDTFWSGILLPTCGSGIFDSRLESLISTVPMPTMDGLLSPVLTSASPRALYQEAGPSVGVVPSVQQSEISSSDVLQLRQLCGQLPPSPRSVTTLTPPSALHQRPTNNTNTTIQNNTSIASRSSASSSIGGGFSSSPSNMQRQHPFSRTHSNAFQGPTLNSSTSQHCPRTQAVGLQARSQMPISYRVSPVFATGHQTASPRPPLTMRAGLTPSPVLMRGYASIPESHTYQGGPQNVTGQATGNIHSQYSQTRFAAPQMSRPVQTSRPTFPNAVNIDGLRRGPVNMDGLRRGPVNIVGQGGGQIESMRGVEQPIMRTDDQNWRPSGRMRGSLSGRDYADAFNQFVIQPTQQGQTTRPISNATSRSMSSSSSSSSSSLSSSQMDILMANRTSFAQIGNHSYTRLASTPGGSGVLPERSSGV